MAIKFLNNLDLGHLEVKNLRLENLPNAPSTGNSSGDLLFNTTTNRFGYYNGTSWVYPEIESVSVVNTTFIDAVNTGNSINPILELSLSATGTPSATKYLRGDNTWANISDIYSWTVSADTGSASVVNSDQIQFAGGTNVTTSYSNGVVTINSSDQYQGTVTSVTRGPGIFGSGSSFSTTGSIALDYNGASNYIITPTSGTPASTSSIPFNDISGNTVKHTTLANIPVTALTAVKTYIDSATAGGVVWQSGYNASTNSPDLDSSTNIAIDKGFMYSVSADGLFFTEQVRVGDTIIANEDMAANGGSALSKFTVIQANLDFATAGTTTSAVRGISAFDSDEFDVSATGFVTLSNPVSSSSSKVSLNSSLAQVTKTSSGGVTTYIVNIAHSDVFGTGALAVDVSAEVIENVTGSTVYVEVVRSGSDVSFKFLTSPSEGDYYVLLQKDSN